MLLDVIQGAMLELQEQLVGWALVLVHLCVHEKFRRGEALGVRKTRRAQRKMLFNIVEQCWILLNVHE